MLRTLFVRRVISYLLHVYWLATRENGHSDICVNCSPELACAVRAGKFETAINDYIRFCPKVDLLKTEETHNQSVQSAGMVFVKGANLSN